MYDWCSLIRNTSEREQYWQPGEHLPILSPVGSSTPHSHRPPSSETVIIDMLRGFQSSVETQFQQLSTHLGKIDERMDEMELQQKTMQEKLQNSSLLSSSSVSTPSSSSSETSGRKRGRVTPTALQVRSPSFHDKFIIFFYL